MAENGTLTVVPKGTNAWTFGELTITNAEYMSVNRDDPDDPQQSTGIFTID